MRLVLISLLALTGCSAVDAPTAPTVEDEITTSTAAPDPLSVAANAYAEGEAQQGGLGLIAADREYGFDLIDCSEEYRLHDPSGPLPGDEVIARRIALIRLSLDRAGYPMAALAPILARFESAEQARVAAGGNPASFEDGYKERLAALAAELDAARVASNPALPRIVTLGECGAGESPTIMRTNPAGGRVWLITRFNFDLCQAKKLDPWDRKACRRWTEADPDAPLFLSGAYVWQARWPDGVVAKGDRRLPPNDSEEPVLVTVGRG